MNFNKVRRFRSAIHAAVFRRGGLLSALHRPGPQSCATMGRPRVQSLASGRPADLVPAIQKFRSPFNRKERREHSSCVALRLLHCCTAESSRATRTLMFTKSAARKTNPCTGGRAEARRRDWSRGFLGLPPVRTFGCGSAALRPLWLNS